MESKLTTERFVGNVVLLLLLIISFIVIGQIISAGIMFAYYGDDAFNFEKILSNKKDNFNIIRMLQIVVSIFCFATPAIIFSYLQTKNSFQYTFQKTSNPILVWILIPLLVITFYPFLNLTYIWNKQTFLGQIMQEQQEQYRLFLEVLLSPKSLSYFIFNFIMIAIVPAIVEEWIFRGTLQKYLSEKCNAHFAILFSSIIFSLIHFEFSAFIPRIFLGILLGYVFYFTKDIWLCIWMHLFNNGMEVTSIYIKNWQNKNEPLFQEPTMPAVSELLSFSILFVLLFYIFYGISKKNKKIIFAD